MPGQRDEVTAGGTPDDEPDDLVVDDEAGDDPEDPEVELVADADPELIEVEVEVEVGVEVEDEDEDEEEEAAAAVAGPPLRPPVRPQPGRPPSAREEPPPPFAVGERVILIQNTRPRTGTPIGNYPVGATGRVETVLSQTAIVRFDIAPDTKEVVAFTCLSSAEKAEGARSRRA